MHGRDEERAQLSAMLDAARQGRAMSLVVRAGAGMGKTALLEDTAQRASDATVLRTAGLQSEEALAFAALHRLLRPAMSAVASLPPPQQRALRTAFGEEDGERFDPFLVGVATLGLLTEVAESGPVLCLIDDAQWLDAASAGAVLFAARRLLAEPVTMIFAARDDADYAAPTDIPELVLSGLSTPAVRSLLTERSGHEPADHVLAELAARTGGNPLALFELPTHLSPEQLGGTSALPTTIPLSARVERVFLDRCRRLSTSAQTLMLLASADDSVRLAVLLRAGGALAVPVDTLTEVESAGLLVTDGDAVRVRHPLVRSAIYQAATASERRAAHAALADALGSIEDRDRRAWHRAAAADGPDDDVAADLDDVGSPCGGPRRVRRCGEGVRAVRRAQRRRRAARASTLHGRPQRLCGRKDRTRRDPPAGVPGRCRRPGAARLDRPASGTHRGCQRVRGRRSPHLHQRSARGRTG